MRDLVIVLLAICCLVLSIGHYIQEYDIVNMKQTLRRVEHGYNEVLAANEQLERINNQNIRLMTEGGWDEMAGSRAAD